MLRTVIIGLGKQGCKEYLPIVSKSSSLELKAICDIQATLVEKISEEYNVRGYTDVDTLLASEAVDIAIVALPHNQYMPIIEKLTRKNIHIFKEKPAAMQGDEILTLQGIMQNSKSKMCIATQRRFHPIYNKLTDYLPKIGELFKIEGKYLFNIEHLGNSWRSNQNTSGGGTIIDMGYHMIDYLIGYFGLPNEVVAHTSMGNREGEEYDVEDTAILQFQYTNYNSTGKNILGSFELSRVGHKKKEKIRIKGSHGFIVITPEKIARYGNDGTVIESFIDRDKTNPVEKQLEYFIDVIDKDKRDFIGNYKDHIQHMALINSAYQSAAKHKVQKPFKEFSRIILFKEGENIQNGSRDFEWPIINGRVKKLVKAQLKKELSIQNKSGIIAELENNFAKYHGRQLALCTNSGTNALAAIFYSLALMGVKEAIFPVYTFHATVSPAISVGIKPIFCDCTPEGNIDPNEIKKKITDRTGAIVITHMWGIPCDMDEIVKIAKERKLYLVEDCSHAHGAKYKGQLVGTFGDVAAWSLQGQKIITGGEAGILVTDNREIYSHAILHGQYNKRVLQEFPESEPLRNFYLTGSGYKNRITTQAAAMANDGLEHLDEWLKYKRHYAAEIIKQLQDIPFLKMPDLTDKEPAWYAFVMQFVPEYAAVDVASFYKKLQEVGLEQVDRPNSTRPLHREPLYTHPETLWPWVWSPGEMRDRTPETDTYPNAQRFYDNALKLPMWATPDDSAVVEKYIDGFKHVAESQLNFSNGYVAL